MGCKNGLPKIKEFTAVDINQLILKIIRDSKSMSSEGNFTAIVCAENIPSIQNKEFKGGIVGIIKELRNALFDGHFDEFVKPTVKILQVLPKEYFP